MSISGGLALAIAAMLEGPRPGSIRGIRTNERRLVVTGMRAGHCMAFWQSLQPVDEATGLLTGQLIELSPLREDAIPGDFPPGRQT